MRRGLQQQMCHSCVLSHLQPNSVPVVCDSVKWAAKVFSASQNLVAFVCGGLTESSMI